MGAKNILINIFCDLFCKHAKKTLQMQDIERCDELPYDAPHLLMSLFFTTNMMTNRAYGSAHYHKREIQIIVQPQTYNLLSYANLHIFFSLWIICHASDVENNHTLYVYTSKWWGRLVFIEISVRSGLQPRLEEKGAKGDACADAIQSFYQTGLNTDTMRINYYA